MTCNHWKDTATNYCSRCEPFYQTPLSYSEVYHELTRTIRDRDECIRALRLDLEKERGLAAKLQSMEQRAIEAEGRRLEIQIRCDDLREERNTFASKAIALERQMSGIIENSPQYVALRKQRDDLIDEATKLKNDLLKKPPFNSNLSNVLAINALQVKAFKLQDDVVSLNKRNEDLCNERAALHNTVTKLRGMLLRIREVHDFAKYQFAECERTGVAARHILDSIVQRLEAILKED